MWIARGFDHQVKASLWVLSYQAISSIVVSGIINFSGFIGFFFRVSTTIKEYWFNSRALEQLGGCFSSNELLSGSGF